MTLGRKILLGLFYSVVWTIAGLGTPAYSFYVKMKAAMREQLEEHHGEDWK